jgi:transcriptional regulator with XRE-family HTH domain
MANWGVVPKLLLWQFSGMTLKDYLASQGLTATEFAKKLGVSASTITRAIKKERRPTWTTLEKIRAATGNRVQPNDFAEAA